MKKIKKPDMRGMKVGGKVKRGGKKNALMEQLGRSQKGRGY